MLEEIYDKINKYHRKSFNWFLFLGIINVILILYFVYRIIKETYTDIFVISFIIIIVLNLLLMIIIKIIYYNKARKIQHEQLSPYLIRSANNNWKLTNDVFTKEEEFNSFIIEKYGTFKSLNKILGFERDINYQFSYISNIISTGNSAYDVFSGTYFSFELPIRLDGAIHIRDKGRPSKIKKLDLECKKYVSNITSSYSDLKFYTDNEMLAERIINDELVKFYLNIKKDYKKGIYFTINNNKLVIGIHNRKNYFDFRCFEKVNQENFDKKVHELRKLDNLIYETCEFIRKII